MMKYSLGCIMLLFNCVSSIGQSKNQITGHIVDAWNGNDVSYSTVWQIGSLQNATIANNYGRFTLPLSEGQMNKIRISSIGYRDTVILIGDPNLSFENLHIKLTPNPAQLEEVIVSATNPNAKVIGFTELTNPSSTLWKNNLTISVGSLSEGGVYLQPNKKYRGRLTSISFYLPTDFELKGDVLIRLIEPGNSNLKGMTQYPFNPQSDKATKRLAVTNPKPGWNVLSLVDAAFLMSGKGLFVFFTIVNKDGSPITMQYENNKVSMPMGIVKQGVKNNYPMYTAIYSIEDNTYSYIDYKSARNSVPAVYLRFIP